ncbi:g1772 [Coccomyxa elongata]
MIKFFRDGGWAVPLGSRFGATDYTSLNCENPNLIAWLKKLETFRQALCSLVGVKCDPHFVHENCEQWTPLAIVTTTAAFGMLALVLLATAASSLAEYFFMWRKSMRSSITDTVKAATTAAAELRKRESQNYPLTPHSWYQLKGQEDELNAPVLCASCFLRIDPEGERVQCCEVCGVVAHDGACARKAPQDCRPVAGATNSMVHLWQPAGTIYYDSEDDTDDRAVQVCVYCHQPCDADVFGTQAVWTCAWCRANAHVSCYQTYHQEPESLTADGDLSRTDGHPDASTSGNGGEQSHMRHRGQSSQQPSSTLMPKGCRTLTRRTSSIEALLNLFRGTPSHKTLDPMSLGPHPHKPAHMDVARLDACHCGSHGRLVLPPTAVTLLPDEDSWSARAKHFLRRDSFLRRAKAKKAASPDRKQADRESSEQPALLSDGRANSGETDDTIAGASPRSLDEVRDFHSDLDESGFRQKDNSADADVTTSGRQPNGHAAGQHCTEQQSQQATIRSADVSRGNRASSADAGSASQQQPDNVASPRPPRLPPLPIEEPSGRAPPPASPRRGRAPADAEAGRGRMSPRSDAARSFMASVSGYVSSTEGAGGAKMRRPGWWRGPAVTSWMQYRIERSRLPPGCSPLLVFLNTRSGPQVGAQLRRRFLRFLNPLQVVELPREEPEAPLRLFAEVPGLRVLVLGGDGTVGWILSCLDSLAAQFAAEPSPRHWAPPPVAILPLGTGNDLARCLNWGGGLYALREKGLPAVLADIEHATVALLDRWDVTITRAPSDKPSASANQLQRMSNLVARDRPDIEQVQKRVMNNYLGVGVDAKVSLEFHRLRDQFPQWFRSQMGNKVWYTTMGAADILGHAIGASSGGLPSKLKVEVDGRPLDLPEDIEGVLLLNIASYMGGVNLWASGAATAHASLDAPQSFCDGVLEVCGVYGSWHLGQLQVGLSRAIRLAQCRSVRITALEALPMQIDGEPWHQPPATLDISLKGQAFMLRRIESGPVAAVARAVSDVLESCETRNVISAAQRHTLTAEIAAKLHPVL